MNMNAMGDRTVTEPAPKIRKSIRIGVRDLEAGVVRLLARLVVSPDGGIILSTPWKRRSGLFLSKFKLTEEGVLPDDSSTFKVGESGVAKCHYHRSGFTSVQSEEGGERPSVRLPALTEIHMQQFAHIYSTSLGWLPLADRLRARDVLYVQGRPRMKSLSLHIVAYNRARLPKETRGRVLEESPVSFASGDSEMFLVDVSSTGLDLILGFSFRGRGDVVPNSPEYSMNMYRLSGDGFGGAIGVQTERDFARFGVLDCVPDLSAVHDVERLKPVATRYPAT